MKINTQERLSWNQQVSAIFIFLYLFVVNCSKDKKEEARLKTVKMNQQIEPE